MIDVFFIPMHPNTVGKITIIKLNDIKIPILIVIYYINSDTMQQLFNNKLDYHLMCHYFEE
jgi:hypothetical protein